jgi:acyl-CoA reductase-like NAD-dependent aldehyde dehydrogenase
VPLLTPKKELVEQFTPTVFVGVTNDMTIAQEEIFGPVLSVITYRDDDRAVAIANDVEYGLHAYVYGEDRKRPRGRQPYTRRPQRLRGWVLHRLLGSRRVCQWLRS